MHVCFSYPVLCSILLMSHYTSLRATVSTTDALLSRSGCFVHIIIIFYLFFIFYFYFIYLLLLLLLFYYYYYYIYILHCIRYVTSAFCGLSGHLLVQTMPWCPG